MTRSTSLNLTSVSSASFVASFIGVMTCVVIGVGHLGKHHARILSTCPARRSSPLSTPIARADEIASAHRTRAVYDAREIVGRSTP